MIATSDCDRWRVRIISKSRLRQFWESRTNDRMTAERDLQAWYKLAKAAAWANFGDLKQTFGSADVVGRCVVFDVGNNRYRLIGRVFYRVGRLYVLKVMDHREYDKNSWQDECECHEPPPAKKRTRAQRSNTRSKTTRRKWR
jgi:mRNA interferase HigB